MFRGKNLAAASREGVGILPTSPVVPLLSAADSTRVRAADIFFFSTLFTTTDVWLFGSFCGFGDTCSNEQLVFWYLTTLNLFFTREVPQTC